MALVACVGLAVAGCAGTGTPQAGVAAKVGDTVITVKSLQDEVGAFAKLQAGQMSDQEIASGQQSLLSQAIVAELHEQLAARADVKVNAADIATERSKIRTALKQNDQELPSDLIDQIARQQAYQVKLPDIVLGSNPSTKRQGNADQLYHKQMSALVDDLGVEVNPRYGSWNEKQSFGAALQGQSMIDPAGGNLVELEQASPTPSPRPGQ